MNKKEAESIILKQLEKYRLKPYSELVKMIDADPITYEVKNQNDIIYQIEIIAFWDSKINDNIRVLCNIDNGGIRTLFPLSHGFIKSPDDTFIDE